MRTWAATARGVGKVSSMVPQAVFQVLAQLEALGIDVKGLLKLLKIDPSGIEALLAGVKPGGAGAPEETLAAPES